MSDPTLQLHPAPGEIVENPWPRSWSKFFPAISAAGFSSLGKIALLALLVFQIAVCAFGLPRSLHGSVDFRAFYAAGHIVANGNGPELYRYAYMGRTEQGIVGSTGQTLPFLYPAYAALLFVPLAVFPYKVAFAIFAALNLVLLFDAARWFTQELKIRRHVPVWIPAALIFCFVPATMTLLQGQISILLLVGYLSAYRLLRGGQPFWAGLILASTLAKFQIALPVAFLMLCWRQWRVIAGFFSGALLTGLLSLVVTGWQGNVEYFRSIVSVAVKTVVNASAAKAAYGMYPSDMPNLHGLFFVLTRGSSAAVWLIGASSLALLLWAARRPPSFLLALITAMLVSYHLQAYDLVLLLLPLAACLKVLLQANHGAVSGIGNTLQRSRNYFASAVCLSLAAILLTFPVAGIAIVFTHAWICVLAPIAMLYWTHAVPPDIPVL